MFEWDRVEATRVRRLFILFVGLSIPPFLFFGFKHWEAEQFLIAGLLAVMAGIILLRPAFSFPVYLASVLFVYIHLLRNILSPGLGPDSFYWQLLIPLFTYVLLGHRLGSITLGFYLVFLSYFSWLPNTTALFSYSEAYKLRFFIAFLLVSAISFLMEYSRYSSQARLNKANERLVLMLREIHHRLKNNLGMISGIIELKEYELQDQEAREMMSELKEKILAVGMIHEHLYRGSSLETLDINAYLEKLAQVVVSDLGGPQIDLYTQVESHSMQIEQAVSLGIIVTELVTNAVKHGFSDEMGRSGGAIRLESWALI
jgi:signal transduction histidine kinase